MLKIFQKGYIIDTFFWLSLLFYLDPAGWFRLNFSDGRFTQFYFFIAIVFLYFLSSITDKNSRYSVYNNVWVRRYSRFLGVFLLYWIGVYCFLNTPMYEGGSVILPIFRTRRVIMEVFLVYPIVYFSKRSLQLFLKLFYLTTVIILGLYFLSIIFKLDIVQINQAQRAFTDTSRNLLYGYGMLPFGVFIGVVTFLLPIKKNRLMKGLILAGVFTVLMWVLTIVRREMLGVILTVIITMVVFSKLFMLNYGRNLKKGIVYLIVVLIFLGIIFPNYITTLKNSFYTIYITFFEKEKSNTTDTKRISLTANTFIINKIVEYPLLGTGYTQKWYVSSGDEEGYEGSDYIFLATFAQNGIVGLLIMLGYYVLVYKIIKGYYRYIKNNRTKLLKYSVYTYGYLIVFFSMSIFFIRHAFEFPNWFYPFGAIADSPKFFIALGLMIGAGDNIVDFMNRISGVNSNIE